MALLLREGKEVRKGRKGEGDREWKGRGFPHKKF